MLHVVRHDFHEFLPAIADAGGAADDLAEPGGTGRDGIAVESDDNPTDKVSVYGYVEKCLLCGRRGSTGGRGILGNCCFGSQGVRGEGEQKQG